MVRTDTSASQQLATSSASWILEEPCFVTMPKGGTKNIGRAAHCLRHILIDIIEDNKEYEEENLLWKTNEFYKITKEKRTIYPTKDSFYNQNLKKNLSMKKLEINSIHPIIKFKVFKTICFF